MALADIFTYHSSLALDDMPKRPWRSGAWIWATNGHFLVALADDGREADAPPETMRKASRYLNDTPSELATLSLPALRVFAGAAPVADAPCPDCDGDGYSEFEESVKCEHCGETTRQPCRRCGGDGLAGVGVRYGRVNGVPVNLVLLAYSLTHVPAEDAAQVGTMQSVGKTAASTGPALVVIGTGWRIVLMAIRAASDSLPSFPEQRHAEPVSLVAVDPSAASTGKPTTRA